MKAKPRIVIINELLIKNEYNLTFTCKFNCGPKSTTSSRYACESLNIAILGGGIHFILSALRMCTWRGQNELRNVGFCPSASPRRVAGIGLGGTASYWWVHEAYQSLSAYLMDDSLEAIDGSIQGHPRQGPSQGALGVVLESAPS